MRKVLTIFLPIVLLLTACGGEELPEGWEGRSEAGVSAGAAEILESVQVTEGAEGEAPTIEFDAPLDITAPAVKTVIEGDGDQIEAGDRIGYHAVFLNADDGSVLQESYSTGQPLNIELTEEMQSLDAELYEVLTGSMVGSQIAYTRPLEPAAGQPATRPNALIVLKVLSAEQPPPPPETLSPEEVAELDSAGQLPTLTFNDEGTPEIEIPETDPPTDLVVKVLEEGTGEEITEADTIAANYSGWTWADGENFDSSYSRGEPTEFPLSGVIPGWTQGLSGLNVGAEVLLVIPGPLAYGDPAPQGAPSGTLVFYVEIVEKVSAE